MSDIVEPRGVPTDLTDEEQDEIIAALHAKGVPRACEMCGVDKWILGQYLTSPLLVVKSDQGVTYNYAKIQTSVALICTNCGNTKLFTVAMLGAPKIPEPPVGLAP
jgi:hypothetical protein